MATVWVTRTYIPRLDLAVGRTRARALETRCTGGRTSPVYDSFTLGVLVYEARILDGLLRASYTSFHLPYKEILAGMRGS